MTTVGDSTITRIICDVTAYHRSGASALDNFLGQCTAFCIIDAGLRGVGAGLAIGVFYIYCLCDKRAVSAQWSHWQ